MPAIKSISSPDELTQQFMKSAPTVPDILNVLIVDDHAIVRWGMKLLIHDAFPDALVMEAGNAQQAHACLDKADWSVVLLDITLPRRSGLEILADFQQLIPGVPVLMLSAHSDGEYVGRALKGGAAGYLTKDTAPSELVTAIETILAGEQYVSQALTRSLATYIASNGYLDSHENLSDRELEVFHRLANGQTVTEISVELSLSIKTISTYRSRIFDKMYLRNISELMRYAFDHGVVQ